MLNITSYFNLSKLIHYFSFNLTSNFNQSLNDNNSKNEIFNTSPVSISLNNSLDLDNQTSSSFLDSLTGDVFDQNLKDIIFFTILFMILDIILVPKKSRWFSLHTISNSLTTFYSFHDFINTWYDPVNAMSRLPNWRPLNITITLHFYHMIFFDNLYWIDWLHHIVMMYVAIYMYLTPITPCINSVIFFVNGLPGGIDYLLLILVKHKIIKPQTEKGINIYLNNWIRSPGILISTYISILIATRYSNSQFESPEIFSNDYRIGWILNNIIMISIPLALYWNSQYFNQRVLINYGFRQSEYGDQTEKKIKEEMSKNKDDLETSTDEKIGKIFKQIRKNQDEKDQDEINQCEGHCHLRKLTLI